jgi:RHS repeat-associated protein
VTVTYLYDGAGNLKTQTDPSGTTSYTYDGRNKVLTKNATSGGGTLTYDYDADSNLVLVKDAGGSTTYTYDTRNLLSSLTDPASNLWQFAYNADGLRTTTWFATNTANTTWAEKMVTSYDKGDRISRIQTYRASSASNVVSDVSYCYSAYVSGQACPTSSSTTTDKALLQWSENNQTSTISQYTYDAGDRLKTATNYGGTSYSYGYDTDGNLTSGGTAGTQTFNSANQVTNTGYTYDGAGNTTATPGLGTLSYNDAEQWTGGSTTGESFAYAGAGMNQVLSDGSATGITYGLAGEAGQAWVQSYTPTSSATDYVIHDQQGTPLGYVQSGTAYGFGTDNIGSVTNVVASNGTTVATYANTPWGHQNSATGTDAAQNLIRYAGALFDPTSSNYSTFGARWYNAYTGAFTTQDTNDYLSNPENGNRYAYASDNPINYTDPTGHQGQDNCSEVDTLSQCSVPSIVYGSGGVNADCGQNSFAIAATIGGVIISWPVGVIGGIVAVAGASTSISGVVEHC